MTPADEAWREELRADMAHCLATREASIALNRQSVEFLRAHGELIARNNDMMERIAKALEAIARRP